MITPGGQAEVKAAAAAGVTSRMAGMRALIPVVTRNNANKDFGWVLARQDVAAVVKAARSQVIASGAASIATAYQRAFEQSRLTATAYLAELGVEPDWSPGVDSAYLQLLQEKWELSASVVFQALYGQMGKAVARVQPRPSLAQDPVNGVPNVFQALGQDKQAALERVLDDGIRTLSFRAGVGATSAAAKAAGEALEALAPPATDNGRLLKRWRISGLPGTCIHCRQLDGVTVPVGANFPIVGPLPVFGNVLSGPPRHPNCRCHLELLPEDLTARVSEPMLDFPAVDPTGMPIGGQLPPQTVAPVRAVSISAAQIRAMPPKTYHSVVAALIGTIRKFWGSAWKRGKKWLGF